MPSFQFLLSQLRESFGLRGKATFWFGGVIAAVVKQLDKGQQTDFGSNSLQADSYTQFLHILNHTVVSAMMFYSQNAPDSFYRFIMFCQQLVNQSKQKHTPTYLPFNLAKMTLRNTLIIHALNLKQYNFVFSQCQQIMREIDSNGIETFHICYLTFFSNFLTILSKLQFTKSTNLKFKNLIQSVQNKLVLVFTKLIEKYQRIVNGQGTIDLTDFEILIAVFIKNKTILQQRISSYFHSLLQKVITQTKYKNIPISTYINKIYKQKIQKQIAFNLEVPFYEFNCFSVNANFYSTIKNKVDKHLSTKQDSLKEDGRQQSQRLERIQKMLEQHLSTINQNYINSQQMNSIFHSTEMPKDFKTGGRRCRRLNKLNSATKNFQQSIEMNQTIEIGEVSLLNRNENLGFMTQRKVPHCGFSYGVTQHVISPTKAQCNVSHMQQKRNFSYLNTISFSNNQSSQLYSNISSNPLPKTHNVLHFKMGSTFIEVNDDGMLFSDYTKQNKRYIEWNTISQILLRVQYKFIYKYCLSQGIFNYYDVVRILKLYLSKTELNTITINEYPNMILQLNEFIRFYQQDGKYTKLAHMNIYDNSKLQSQIDCYFQEFQHFFKTVSSDGYPQYLEQKVFHFREKERNFKEQVFYLEVLRKNNESIKLELQNQLTVDVVESVTNDREFLYRALFVLKNNFRLYAKIQLDQTSEKQQQCKDSSPHVIITIKSLLENTFKKIQHKISCDLLRNYIPQGELTSNVYLKNHGRFIFECLNNFENFSDDPNPSSLNFEIITHCCLTEMIEIGKYWTVCSAELIGSKRTIYGIVIRYAFLPMNKDVVTFLKNPYCGFLNSVISMTKQQRKECLKKLLIQESVKKTYLYLQKKKKVNQVISLIEYLSEGLGIM